jgi:hypothetical protein
MLGTRASNGLGRTQPRSKIHYIEAKCCLLLSTADEHAEHQEEDTVLETTPLDLFRVSRSRNIFINEEITPENLLGIDVATQGGMAVGAMASVRELAFAFERASSRIIEMCSRSWWDKRLSSERKV